MTLKVKPFLKWAGGKQRLLPQYAEYLPQKKDYKRYIEPFLGGGALYYLLNPSSAILSDINYELIEVYTIVRDEPEDLIDALQNYHNDKDFYYEVRSLDPAELSSIERVARFIFLNKTCFNGLYRVNQQGRFNVPFGRYKNPKIRDVDGIMNASQRLQNTLLRSADFEWIRDCCEANDFVYFDPPYAPLNATSNFTGYTNNGFSAEDQIRLSELFHHLNERECLVMLSNSDVPAIRDLYDGYGYRIHTVQARRVINSNGKKRGFINELLIANF